MRTLTLTPDVRAYATAAAVVYSLSCAWLAGIVVARSARARGAGFLVVYVAILVVVAAPAVVVLDPVHVTGPALWRVLLAIPIGVIAGGLCVWAEVLVVRAVRRRRRARSRGPVWHAVAAPPAAVRDDAFGVVPGQPRRLATLALLLAVATLEEILFRGVLLDLAVSLPGDLAAGAAICGIAIAFALTHVSFGWVAVVAKLPLAAIATAVTLATGTVAAAAAAHAVVNVRAWRA